MITRWRRRRDGRTRVPRAVVATCAAAASIASLGFATTSALLADNVSTGQVEVTAGSLDAPTGLSLTDATTAIRVAFTAPAGGLTPADFEVDRRSVPGSYPGTVFASTSTSPWDDTTAAECTTWGYRVRSRHTNLHSAWSSEEQLMVDRTAPAVSDAHLVWTTSSPSVADFVRVSPGGNVEVYAEVTDNCASQSALDVDFAFGAPFNSTVAATYSATGWTPISGGPTYHHRFTYALPASAVADGQVVTWDVVASDPSGNQSTTAGTPFTGDGAGPVFVGAELVSAYTNFYSTTLGRGEIPSDGTARASGSWIYADFTDASGVASVTGDLAVTGSVIKTGASAVPLAAGSYTTVGSPTTWPWRSAATVVNTGLTNGNRSFRVTATDAVGNAATTSPNQTVEIDDTPPTSGASSCANFGTNNGRLDNNDRTEIDFGDTVWPGSLAPGWTGSVITATATLRNGTRDYFDLNADFGLTMFEGSAYDEAWNLNATTWVTTNTAYAGSTFDLADRTTARITYHGGNVADRNKNARAYISTTVRDAAGNQVTASYNEACTTGTF
jgi:hypothetical protein